MQKNIYPGRFIVFDGLDGSGQSTQAAKLVDFLNEKKQKMRFGHIGAYLTKEPTSGLIGGLIRGQLSSDWKTSAECLQLLFAADRAHHLEKEIIPMLQKGAIMVCDRYFFSSFAYGMVDIRDKEWIFKINQNFLLPDITFFLKVSPKVCIERIHSTRHQINLFEQEKILKKVQENYKKIAKRFKNMYVVDGEKPIDKTAKEIVDIVVKNLDKKSPFKTK